MFTMGIISFLCTLWLCPLKNWIIPFAVAIVMYLFFLLSSIYSIEPTRMNTTFKVIVMVFLWAVHMPLVGRILEGRINSFFGNIMAVILHLTMLATIILLIVLSPQSQKGLSLQLHLKIF